MWFALVPRKLAPNWLWLVVSRKSRSGCISRFKWPPFFSETAHLASLAHSSVTQENPSCDGTVLVSKWEQRTQLRVSVAFATALRTVKNRFFKSDVRIEHRKDPCNISTKCGGSDVSFPT